MTPMMAVMRRLVCRNIGATASGPLRSWYRRSLAAGWFL